LNRNRFFASLIILIFAFTNVYPKPTVKATFVQNPPKIDGELEPLWENVTIIKDFYQREPNTGEPVSEKTLVYICYDKDNIYFGFKCYDDPASITAKEMARDVSLRYDDRVQIILDTFLDHRNAYWFQIGPRGSIGDALVSQNGAAFNKQWDGLWTGKAKINNHGWDAEVAIPFKTMNFRTGQTTWGLKLIRHILHKQESAYWPQANLNAYVFQVSDAGLLVGLEGITQGIGLDVSPYGLAGLDQEIGQKHHYPLDAGFDIFYQITPALKSALTVNTDFAQTEVDSRQINLTRFALHFPEKRNFFLDGASYFNFGIDGDRQSPYSKRLIPFFSRRLGLDEEGNPIPIVWGAKMTGQAGPWNLGFLNIMDERNDRRKNFTVARISRNIGNQSSVGLIATNGNTLSTAGSSLFGMDMKLASSSFRGNKNIALILFGLKSSTDSLKNDDWAFGGEIVYPNDFLFYRIGFHQIDKNFRAGIGFVPRLDIRESYAEFSFGPRPKRWGLLQIFFKTGIDYITDMVNQLQTRKIDFTPIHLRFLSGDEVIFTTSSQFERLNEDFDIYTDHIIPTGIYQFRRHTLSIESARRRNFWSTFQYTWGHFYNGNRQEAVLAFGYKVSVPLFIGSEYEHNDVWLTDGKFSTDIIRLNANILFSPDVTLYNFIQYDSFSKSMGWQSRFRWILSPGNEILFVWNSVWDDPLERYRVQQSTTRIKVKYNYRF